jgi:hypothetical protein
VEQAGENAEQLESLRKELMQMRKTISSYQVEEDASARQRLLDEAEARRRAMLAGVGYADLVQCRNFLNEFRSDEMLVRWASLRWSIIALGSGVIKWWRIATKGNRAGARRAQQIRNALGHWVNRRVSMAMNRWLEFSQEKAAAYRLARRSLAHWLRGALAAGFNTWREQTQDALGGACFHPHPPYASTALNVPLNPPMSRSHVHWTTCTSPLDPAAAFAGFPALVAVL